MDARQMMGEQVIHRATGRRGRVVKTWHPEREPFVGRNGLPVPYQVVELSCGDQFIVWNDSTLHVLSEAEDRFCHFVEETLGKLLAELMRLAGSMRIDPEFALKVLSTMTQHAANVIEGGAPHAPAPR